jgi:hypothetical protein
VETNHRRASPLDGGRQSGSAHALHRSCWRRALTSVVRSMTRIILTVFSLLGSVLPVGAQQQPSQSVFEQSSRDLVFSIPAGFQPVSEDRRYLRPETHEVPRFQRMWAHGSDGIIISIIVIPDAACPPALFVSPNSFLTVNP